MIIIINFFRNWFLIYCICMTKCRAGFATDSRADRTAPISKRFLLPNIIYILIIHSGPVARDSPDKKHGQDSSTSQLESIRFKYLRLKLHLKELRTCPECKNRYAKHTCIKALHVTRCNFSCNLQRYSTLGRCKIRKYTFPSQFASEMNITGTLPPLLLMAKS